MTKLFQKGNDTIINENTSESFRSGYRGRRESIVADLNFALILILGFTVVLKIFVDVIATTPQLIIQAVICAALVLLNFNRIDKRYIAFLAVSFAYIAAVNIFHGALGVMTYMFNIVAMAVAFNHIVLKKEHVRMLFFALALSLFFAYVSCKKVLGYFHMGTRKTYNPNQMGVYLFLMVLAGNFAIDTYRRNLIGDLCRCAVILLGGILLVTTSSRTAMVALLIYVLGLAIRDTKLFLEDRSYKIVVLVCWALVFCVAAGYVAAYHVLPEGIRIFGKKLFTGRQDLWIDAFKKIFRYPITGFGLESDLVYGNLNTHNSMLGVMKLMGIYPGIFIGLIYFMKKGKYGNYRNMPSARCAVAAVFFVLAFEMYFLYIDVYVLIFFPVLNRFACGSPLRSRPSASANAYFPDIKAVFKR